jgi:hypothetical protein
MARLTRSEEGLTTGVYEQISNKSLVKDRWFSSGNNGNFCASAWLRSLETAQAPSKIRCLLAKRDKERGITTRS